MSLCIPSAKAPKQGESPSRRGLPPCFGAYRLRLRTPTFRRGAAKSPSAPPRHSNNDQPVPRRTGSESQAIATFGTIRVPSDSPASSFQFAPAASVSYTRVQSPKRQRPLELSAPRLTERAIRGTMLTSRGSETGSGDATLSRFP